MSLIELIVCTVVIGILSATALPLTRNFIRYQKEQSLKETLRTLREAIDRFYESKRSRNPRKPEGWFYPQSLEELVRSRFIRRIPIDPITGVRKWKTLSSTDPSSSGDSDLVNVFDIRSTASGTGFDGTPYSDW